MMQWPSVLIQESSQSSFKSKFPRQTQDIHTLGIDQILPTFGVEPFGDELLHLLENRIGSFSPEASRRPRARSKHAAYLPIRVA